MYDAMYFNGISLIKFGRSVNKLKQRFSAESFNKDKALFDFIINRRSATKRPIKFPIFVCLYTFCKSEYVILNKLVSTSVSN